MGLFSARRSEDYDGQQHDDKNIVRVIRSRFYGKQSVKQDRKFDSPSTAHSNTYPSTSQQRSPEQQQYASTSANTTPHRSHRTLPATPSQSADGTPRVRASADTVTLTLAQRLQELALANSEGLLDDDEYRLLRQSLFDRFAGNATVPTETPLVPLSIGTRSTARAYGAQISPGQRRRPSSHFDARTSGGDSSIQSKRSFSSTVSGFLRRATSSNRSSVYDDFSRSDTTSIFSFNSISRKSSRGLSKQTSAASLRSDVTDFPTSPSHSRNATTPSTSRSSTRSRRHAPPPSAFHAKVPPTPPPKDVPPPDKDNSDDPPPQSAKDIRREIESVEAEGRRLLDAFNGLELGTLVRQKQPTLAPIPIISTSFDEGPWSSGASVMTHERGSLRGGSDADGLSVHSNGSSIRTMLSSNKSPTTSRVRRQRLNGGHLESGSLRRQGSGSTMSLRSKAGGSIANVSSPLAARPLERLRLGSSTSTVNLARSNGHLPLATVNEDTSNRTSRDGGPFLSTESTIAVSRPSSEVYSSLDHPVAEETADIRRRKAEVTARYEARLEYLRARLKGAELREKLMKT